MSLSSTHSFNSTLHRVGG